MAARLSGGVACSARSPARRRSRSGRAPAIAARFSTSIPAIRASDLGMPRAVVAAQKLRRADVARRRRAPRRRDRAASRCRPATCSAPARRSAAPHAPPRRPARCAGRRAASATCATIGQSMRRPSRRSAPRTPQARRFSAASKASSGIAASAAARGPVSIQTTAEACAAVAVGEGDQGEGPARAVDLGRDVRVRRACGHGEDQRLLAVAPAPRADAERLAQRAVAAVGGDDERARAPGAPSESAASAASVRGVTRSTRTPARSAAPGSSASRATISRRKSQLGRFQPKTSAPISSRLEVRRLADHPLGAAGVGDAHHPERRRLRRQPLPEAGALEKLHGRLQEGGAAQVRALGLGRGHRRHRIDAEDREAGAGEGGGGGQPRHAAARHQHVDRDPLHAGEPRSGDAREEARKVLGLVMHVRVRRPGPTSTVRTPSPCGTARLRASSSNIAARRGVEPVQREDRGEGRRLAASARSARPRSRRARRSSPRGRRRAVTRRACSREPLVKTSLRPGSRPIAAASAGAAATAERSMSCTSAR